MLALEKQHDRQQAEARHESVATVLAAWRRRAVDTVMLANSLAFLPGLIIQLAFHGRILSWQLQASLLALYLSFVAGALLRAVDYRYRVWAVVILGNLLAFSAGIAYPEAPFARLLPIFMAVLTLALAGLRSARVATGLGVAVILLQPLIRLAPGSAQLVIGLPVQPPASLSVALTESVSLTTALLLVMLVLEHFHSFLISALTAERQSTESLAREAEALAAARQELLEEMRERERLQRDIARIGDDERRRLGQEVHDGVCQEITGALLRCQALEQRLARGATLVPDDLGTLALLLEEAMDDAHGIARGLCPLEARPGALAAALRALARRTQQAVGVPCRFHIADGADVPDQETAQQLYRIAQEAVSNAARHARARRIEMRIDQQDDEIVLTIDDDGIGMPADMPAGGMGLTSMACRAQAIGGLLTIEQPTGGGTRVTCRAPLTVAGIPGERTLT